MAVLRINKSNAAGNSKRLYTPALGDHDIETARGKWLFGRVVETYPDKQGHVRQVLMRTSTGNVKRPISKLCLMLRQD